jgi:hypothetical protein
MKVLFNFVELLFSAFNTAPNKDQMILYRSLIIQEFLLLQNRLNGSCCPNLLQGILFACTSTQPQISNLSKIPGTFGEEVNQIQPKKIPFTEREKHRFQIEKVPRTGTNVNDSSILGICHAIYSCSHLFWGIFQETLILWKKGNRINLFLNFKIVTFLQIFFDFFSSLSSMV